MVLEELTATLQRIEGLSVEANWQLPNQRSGLRLKPASVEATAETLKALSEARQPVALWKGDCGALDTPVWLDSSELDNIVEYQKEDLVISVQTGMRFGELRQLLQAEKHELPLAYPDNWRLSDILALGWSSLNSGLRRQLKEYVLGTQLVDATGTISRSGGKVVKNVTGYDLHKFYVGSWHQFGLITEVALRLGALPERTQAWALGFPNWEAAEAWSRQQLEQPEAALSALELAEPQIRPAWLPEQASSWPVFAFVEAKGPASLVRHLDETMMVKDPETLGLFALTEEQRREVIQALGGWPYSSLALQVGCPFNGWLDPLNYTRDLLNSGPDKPTLIQARPAVGLVQVRYSDNVLETPKVIDQLRQLHQYMAEADKGWLQVIEAPSALYATIRELNASAYGDVSSLKELKTKFDPAAVLSTKVASLV